MINAPSNVVAALENGNFEYANLVTVNLGDVYGTQSDYILYLTDNGKPVTFNGHVFNPDNNLTEIAGITRKSATGSDAVEIRFSVTDENLVQAIKSQRYINKASSIERVLIQDGTIIDDFSIPVRTAWGLSHTIDGDIEDRVVSLKIDSSLGDLLGTNGWYALNSSHEKRYPGDKIMQHSGTVMTDDQNKRYTTDHSGAINEDIKPPSMPVIYGYKNVELIPILRLTHRKSHTSYRHYFTTWIYAISVGEVEEVDIYNLKANGEAFEFKFFDSPDSSGGWCCGIRTPSRAEQYTILEDPNLQFWKTNMDSGEKARLNNMSGKGLTLLFIRDRNRNNWSSTPKLTVPVKGLKVYDPRLDDVVYTRNPALQLADYLQNDQYGGGKNNITLSNDNIIDVASHFDNLPDAGAGGGITHIKFDMQLDTSEEIYENMQTWVEGVRLYTSDYYGEFLIRVETKQPTVLSVNEDDLVEYPTYESGEFTDRLNQLTYSISQLVPDESTDAAPDELVEIEVEAIYPPEGDPIHVQWLDEDAGIINYDSKKLDYITELEQAYYWCSVDARISREPRELEITLGPLGWLLEVGDVISFTSEIIDEVDQLWRVDEVSEDDGDVTLDCIAYSDTFYTPDPNSVPDPIPFVSQPKLTVLNPVAGLSISNKKGNFYLEFIPLNDATVDLYMVELYQGETLILETTILLPPLLLPPLDNGNYDVTVTAVGNGNEGDPATLNFDIELPKVPTSTELTVGDTWFSIRPIVADQAYGTFYNYYLRGTDPGGQRELKIENSSIGTFLGLEPETTYYFSVEAINPIGTSGFYEGTTTTIEAIAGNPFPDGVGYEDLDRETQDLIDQLDRNKPGNLPESMEMLNVTLSGNVENQLNDIMTEYETLLVTNEQYLQSIKFADANFRLDEQADEQAAQAQSILTLIAKDEEHDASFVAVNTAFIDEQQATATEFSNVRAEMDLGDSTALANANDYTRASIGYCQTSGGAITGHETVSACEAAGHNWIEAPLAESIGNVYIETDSGSATVQNLMQTFEDTDGELKARASLALDVNGRVTGVFATADANETNIDFVADSIRFVEPVTYNPRLYWSGSTLIFKGNVILDDGFVVDSQETIRGNDGVDGKDGINGTNGSNGSDGDRGAGRFTATTTGTSWNNSAANAAVTNGVAVIDDVVTMFNAADPNLWTETRTWNGSSWQQYALQVHGSVLIQETVNAGKLIVTNSSDTRKSVTIDPDNDAPFYVTGTDGTVGGSKTIFEVVYGSNSVPAYMKVDGFVEGEAGADFIKSGAAITDEALKEINPWFTGGGTSGTSSSTTVSCVTGDDVKKVSGSFKMNNGATYYRESSSRGYTSQNVTVTVTNTTTGKVVFPSKTFYGSARNSQDREYGSPAYGEWEGNFNTDAAGGFVDDDAAPNTTNNYRIDYTVSGGTNGDTSYSILEFVVTPQGWSMPQLGEFENGYWIDPSTGFCIQWGYLARGSGSGDFTRVYFPMDFTTCFGVSITAMSSRNDGLDYASGLQTSLETGKDTWTWTTTDFKLTHSGASSGITWIAYGIAN